MGLGLYTVDFDVSRATMQADRMNATGTANMSGKVDLAIANTGYTLPGTRDAIIVSAASGVTGHDGLTLNAPVSAVAKFSLVYPNANDIVVRSAIDFAPSDLNRNQRAIGQHVNDIQLRGGTKDFAPFAERLFAIPDSPTLGGTYDRLSPEPYLAISNTALFSNLLFSDSILSCGARLGQHRYARSGQCGWFSMSGGGFNQSSSRETLPFDREGLAISGGLQQDIDDRWTVGFGAGYQHNWLTSAELSNSTGDQFDFGGSLGTHFNNTSFAASFSGGYAKYDTRRNVKVADFATTASASPRLRYFSNHLRLAHNFARNGAWYVRPMLDQGVTFTHMNALRENDIPVVGLDIRTSHNTYVTLEPALEFGGEIKARSGVSIRPFAKAGATTFLDGTEPAIEAAFQGAPAGTSTFMVRGMNNRVYADISGGLDVGTSRGVAIRLMYVGRFSDLVASHTGALRIDLPF